MNPTAPEMQLIEEYLRKVLSINDVLNLTRIEDFNQGKTLHIEDSLAALDEVESAPEGQLIDLGTGGGFPGVPLAIVTKRPTTLIDARAKKIKAIDDILKELSIEGVKTHAGRIEEFALENRNAFAVATARALTALPSLLELAAPLLCIKGHLIAYHANVTDEELGHAMSLENRLGMRFVSRRDFALGKEGINRTIIVFERIAEPSVELPRRPGMAQKRPYRN